MWNVFEFVCVLGIKLQFSWILWILQCVKKNFFVFILPYPSATPFITISIPSVNLIFFATYLEVPTQYELKSQKSANFGKQKTRFTSPFLKFLEWKGSKQRRKRRVPAQNVKKNAWSISVSNPWNYSFILYIFAIFSLKSRSLAKKN